jgi:subtilase family serine protease
MDRVNTEFAKMAAMGFSILVASGDDGTGHTGIFSCGTFMPNFPGTLPFVTAVGGTYLTQSHDEIAISFSSGGFSTYFSQPPYQQSAIGAYLKQKGLPPSSYWNATGRGFPDLSALSTNFLTIVSNYPGYESGTSVATPVVAGMISLINDQRIGSGKAPLGFLNPWLYKLNNVGRDITQGNNKDEMCSAGFPVRSIIFFIFQVVELTVDLAGDNRMGCCYRTWITPISIAFAIGAGKQMKRHERLASPRCAPVCRNCQSS